MLTIIGSVVAVYRPPVIVGLGLVAVRCVSVATRGRVLTAIGSVRSGFCPLIGFGLGPVAAGCGRVAFRRGTIPVDGSTTPAPAAFAVV